MRSLGTAYAMYFNIKYKRSGNLFVKPFRSRHIDSDGYLRRVVQYVHLNPIEIFERGWKSGNVGNKATLEQRLSAYQYSSLPEYMGATRPENSILDPEAVEMISDGLPAIASLIEEATDYYEELAM